MSDEEYANIRHAELLGGIIGARVVDVTQQDAEEFDENGQSYVALHFDNGVTVRFQIGDEGFDVEDLPDSEEQ